MASSKKRHESAAAVVSLGDVLVWEKHLRKPLACGEWVFAVIHLPPCDSDGQAIGMEIQPLLLRPMGLGIVLVDDPAEDIRDFRWVLRGSVSFATTCSLVG